MSKQDFILKMEHLNINVGDIVYIETQLSPDFFNPILASGFINRMIEYLGDDGTIVMSLSGYNYGLDKEEIDMEYVPAFNQDSLDAYSKSRMASFIHSLSGSKVSDSNFFPFVAYGKYAQVITSNQSFDFPNGVQSPFARMYELRAKVLLVEHNIKDFLLNDHCVEISSTATVTIDSGIVDKDVKKYLRKVERDLVNKLFVSKKYKELFYYTSYEGKSLLSVSVRDYVDFCVRTIER